MRLPADCVACGTYSLRSSNDRRYEACSEMCRKCFWRLAWELLGKTPTDTFVWRLERTVVKVEITSFDPQGLPIRKSGY